MKPSSFLFGLLVDLIEGLSFIAIALFIAVFVALLAGWVTPGALLEFLTLLAP